MLDVLDFIMDWAQMVWYLILIVVSTITTWRIRIHFKSKMERGLNRRVEDWELVSMNQWMNMYDAGDEKPLEGRNGVSREWIKL